MDISESIVPRSDQLNADDLITGPRTITITGVTKGSSEQPVNIVTAEFGAGRPYKPSKSMRRILVSAWGPEASAYVGRRLTIYRDPDITFGRDKVGGIRISHLSHIEKRHEVALTVTRGKRSTFAVEPLPDEPSENDAITKPQLQKLSILRQKCGYADTDEDRAKWFERIRVITNHVVASNKELSKAEASVVIDVLENPEPQENEQ